MLSIGNTKNVKRKKGENEPLVVTLIDAFTGDGRF